MRYILLLIPLILFGCGESRKEREHQRKIDEYYRAEVAKIQGGQAEELADPNAEYRSILERVKVQTDRISENEFDGKLSVKQFADSMDNALKDCSDYLVSKLDATDADFEFTADTHWLNSIPDVLFELELNHTTSGMMQANKFHREMTRRMVDKYYNRLLAVIPKREQATVKDTHGKWLKSIDADYALAGRIAAYQDGTMILVTWSGYVDDLLYERIGFYYNCFKSVNSKQTLTD